MTEPAANQLNQPAEGPLNRRAAIVTWGLLLLYLVVFFSADQFHRSLGWLLLVPDELLSQWVGQDWSRVVLWDRLPLLLLVSVMLTSAWGWGYILLRPLRVLPGISLAEGRLFCLAVGLSFLSLCTLALGCAGFLQTRRLVYSLVDSFSARGR